ncbi:hypothetical protein NDU88_007137 [Pleurodeles waltl]|uniref:Uncharacterized protein n=1 Tax=Pleurodeles waltl TaxID=8319 RepID=A0AAV7UN06_PLEWA|nr:hypothetical protein NDU88_007137 [Pleurodeles waltl]
MHLLGVSICRPRAPVYARYITHLGPSSVLGPKTSTAPACTLLSSGSRELNGKGSVAPQVAPPPGQSVAPGTKFQLRTT